MRASKAIAVILLLSMFSASASVVCSESTDADTYLVQEGDVSVSTSISSATLELNDSALFWFDIKDNSTKDIVVYINARNFPSDVTASYPNGNRTVVEAGEISSVQVKITVGALVDFTTTDLNFEVKIVDPDRGLPIISNTPHTITVTVNQNIDTGSAGKFLGVFDDNLPSFMGESWFAALVTFVLIIAIGGVVCFWLVPLVQNRKGGSE